MKLGEHPILRPILESIFSEKMAFFRNLAASLGVRGEDADDVINDAYVRLHNLDPEGEIKKRLRAVERARVPSPEDLEVIKSDLTALFVHYLKLECLSYHKRQKKQMARNISLEAEMQAGWSPVFKDHGMVRFLLEAGLPAGLNAEMTNQQDPFTIKRVINLMADLIGWNEQERKFVLFRMANPDARNQDFDPLMPAYAISRNKTRAFIKLMRHLGY